MRTALPHPAPGTCGVTDAMVGAAEYGDHPTPDEIREAMSATLGNDNRDDYDYGPYEYAPFDEDER